MQRVAKIHARARRKHCSASINIYSSMVSIKDKIEKMYRIPCGPVDISADGVCRRSLEDHLDALLDRLTEEVNQTPLKSQIPRGVRVSEDGKSFFAAEENLQGNSKLLQDVTGKLSGWRGG